MLNKLLLCILTFFSTNIFSSQEFYDFPTEVLQTIITNLAIKDRLNIVFLNSSIHKKLLINTKDNPQNIQIFFTINDRDLYLRSIVWCGKNDKKHILTQLLANETEANEVPRTNLFYCYQWSKGFPKGSNRAQKIIAICKNPDMIENYGITSLHWTIIYQSYGIKFTRLLLTYLDPNPNIPTNDGVTPLFSAFYGDNKSDRLELINLLLAHPKLNINALIHGRHILHHIIHSGTVDDLKLLLEHSEIDINAKASMEGNFTSRSHTPLQYAVDQEKLKVIKLLLSDKRIDLNAQDDLGITPLMHAISQNYHDRTKKLKIIKHVIKHPQCDPNIKDHDGNTALHHAAKDPDIVELLLANHFVQPLNLLIRNQQNKTAIDKLACKGAQAFREKSCKKYTTLLQKLAQYEDISASDKVTRKYLQTIFPIPLPITTKDENIFFILYNTAQYIYQIIKNPLLT